MLDTAAFARIVRAILADPWSEENIRAFFDLAFHYVRSYIDTRLRNWRLPLEEFAGPTPGCDLAIEVISSFQESEGKPPFHLVLDSIRKRTDERTTDRELEILTKGIIASRSNQVIDSLRWSHKPEHGKLRRRIHEITSDGDYELFDDAATTLIRWKNSANPCRDECPLIDDPELYPLVATAVGAHSQTPARIRATFAALDSTPHVRNAIPRVQLVRVFCRVCGDFAGQGADSAPSAEVDRFRAYAKERAAEAITETMNEVFPRFESKRGFDARTRDAYERALGELADDLIEHGEYDSLPRYLKPLLTDPEGYLSAHKHSWESMVKRFLEILGGAFDGGL